MANDRLENDAFRYAQAKSVTVSNWILRRIVHESTKANYRLNAGCTQERHRSFVEAASNDVLCLRDSNGV